MEIQYYDKIHKTTTTIKASAKVVHFLEKEKQKHKTLTDEEIAELKPKAKEEYLQRRFEKSVCSLDEMLEKGYDPTALNSIEIEIERRHREFRYLNSASYKTFRAQLKDEIKKASDSMPDYIREVMFMRFFRDMSIGEIARELKLAKGTVQRYLGRGTSFIKEFLKKDIKEQDRLERIAMEKRRRRQYEKMQNKR